MSETVSTPAASGGVNLVGGLWAVFAISIWSGWIVVTRLDLLGSQLDVFDIAAIRFATAGGILLPIVWSRGWLAPNVGVAGTLVMVAGAGIGYVLVSSAGLRYAPAGHAGALIPGVMPLFAALLSVVVLRERIVGRRRFGLVLIPIGVLLIVGLNLLHPAGQRWIGHGLFLTAAFLWASFTVTLRRSGASPIHAAALVAVWSSILFLPIYAVALPHRLADASWSTILFQAFFQGVLTSVVSLIAFNRAVVLLGAARAATFGALVPALAALVAAPVLGELLGLSEVAGIAIVTLGVLFASGAIGKVRKAGGSIRPVPPDATLR